MCFSSFFLFRFLPTTLPSRSGARALVLLPQQSFVRVCVRHVACLCELRGKVHGEKKHKCVCVVKRGATLAGAFLLNQQSEFEKFSERKFLAELGFGVCFFKGI